MKKISTKVKPLQTGGDGTAYMGEETMTPAQKRKDTMLKKKYDKSDMKKNMQDQYGKEEGKKVYFATIRKQAMESTSPEEFYEALGIGALLKGALASAGGKAFLGGLGRGAMMSLPYIIAPKTMMTVAGLSAAGQGAGLLKQTVRKSAAEKENENLRLRMQMGEEADEVKEGVGSAVRGAAKFLLKKAKKYPAAGAVGLGAATGTNLLLIKKELNQNLPKKDKSKELFYKEDNIQEILDKKDVPHVKKLVKKLRSGSKTHAKQADDLEKAMNEQLGGTGPKVAPSSEEMKKKLTKTVDVKTGGTIKKPTVIMPDGKELPGLGGGGGGTDAITAKSKSKSLGKKIKDVGKLATVPFRAALGIKSKPDPTEKFATENTAIESELIIQDWNSDDIKFTEIETVDIIKAEPLKENIKKKIIVKGIKALGNLSKKTKIKTISPKPVATPGTTFASGGKFPPGTFSNVSDYAGALPKPTKTGGGVYSTTYDLGTSLSPGAIKPTKGAFKGGGSLKGRIDPDTGDRVPVKDYIDIMKSKGKKYYEPVKGAKFGDKIMATKRKAFEPLKQEKLPYPKPRTDVKKSKFKVRDDATFGDQIMVRKNEPFSRNFIGRTPMPKPYGKAKYEVGKDGATEFVGGADTFSKVNRRFADKKYNLPGIKKPASAPKDASKLYTPKDSYYSTSKKNENILNTVKPDRKTGSSVNPEAGRVLFGKGELKTGVKKKGKTIYKESMSNWREDLGEDWQKVNRKDKTDGLSRKAVKAYRRENPGSKLQTAVTKDPKKLKKGSKSAKRRLSFCRRMKGMKKKLTSAKTRRDPDSRINKALRRWNC